MFCDFRKAFGLDPEYNKQLEESMQEAEKKALKEKWCCTCEYYIPVDPTENRIAMTVLADFIFLGHQQNGSWALSSDKTELFAMACGAYLDIIAETFNSQGIPNLIDINGDHFAGITDYPKLTHGDIEDADIAKVSAFVKDMVGIGVLVPDDGLEDYIRQIGKLPERTDDTRELSQTREEQQGQNEPPEPETAAGKEPKEDDEEISEEVVEAAKKRLGRV